MFWILCCILGQRFLSIWSSSAKNFTRKYRYIYDFCVACFECIARCVRVSIYCIHWNEFIINAFICYVQWMRMKMSKRENQMILKWAIFNVSGLDWLLFSCVRVIQLKVYDQVKYYLIVSLIALRISALTAPIWALIFI